MGMFVACVTKASVVGCISLHVILLEAGTKEVGHYGVLRLHGRLARRATAVGG